MKLSPEHQTPCEIDGYDGDISIDFCEALMSCRSIFLLIFLHFIGNRDSWKDKVDLFSILRPPKQYIFVRISSRESFEDEIFEEVPTISPEHHRLICVHECITDSRIIPVDLWHLRELLPDIAKK